MHLIIKLSVLFICIYLYLSVFTKKLRIYQIIKLSSKAREIWITESYESILIVSLHYLYDNFYVSYDPLNKVKRSEDTEVQREKEREEERKKKWNKIDSK